MSVPPLFLGVSFLVLVVSVNHLAPPDLKIWSQAAAGNAARGP